MTFIGDRLVDGASCFSLDCHDGDTLDSDTSETFERASSPPEGPHEANLGPPSDDLPGGGTPREEAPHEKEASDPRATSNPQYPEIETFSPALGCSSEALFH